MPGVGPRWQNQRDPHCLAVESCTFGWATRPGGSHRWKASRTWEASDLGGSLVDEVLVVRQTSRFADSESHHDRGRQRSRSFVSFEPNKLARGPTLTRAASVPVPRETAEAEAGARGTQPRRHPGSGMPATATWRRRGQHEARHRACVVKSSEPSPVGRRARARDPEAERPVGRS